MTNKIAPVTEFSWLRMLGYTALTCLIWLALGLLIPAIAHGAGASWIDVSFPGMGLALACGVAWECVRRDRARKRRR